MQPPDYTEVAEVEAASDTHALAVVLRGLNRADRPRAARTREVVVRLSADADPYTPGQ